MNKLTNEQEDLILEYMEAVDLLDVWTTIEDILKSAGHEDPEKKLDTVMEALRS